MADPKPKTLADCILHGGLCGRRFKHAQALRYEYTVDGIIRLEDDKIKGDSQYVITMRDMRDGRPNSDLLSYRGKDLLIEPTPSPQQPSALKERVENSLLNKG